MSISQNPLQAVPELLAPVNTAKQYTRERTRREEDADGTDDPNSSNSKIEDIEGEVRQVTNFLPNVKGWEESVIKQFLQLEKALDDVFNYPEDVFNYPEVEEDVRCKLNLMKKGIVLLQNSISKVEMTINRNLTMMSSKPKSLPSEGDDYQVSKEWVDLGIEYKIFESEAMDNLFVSFHCVESSQVKMCLLCLSIFPENSVIKKRPLIYWWIGEGLVANNGSKTAEEVGEEVFHELLNEGFIKPSKQNGNAQSVNSFIVDPWIRRMLILAAERNEFLTFSPQRTPSNGLRRAFLWRGNDGMSNGDKVEELLTVFNIDEQYLGTRKEWLEKMHKVEVLQLGRWRSSPKYHIEVENNELVNGLGLQKHLKYLSLRGISRIENLPESILKLISLKILDLRACHNLEKLPQGISALKNLTHLDVSECYLLESMPKGLEHLISLRVLKGFVIGRSGKNSCKISDLTRFLKYLRKLSVRIGDDKEAQQEDQLQSLANFSDLQILTISWGVISSAAGPVPLPERLRKLDLRYAPLRAAPNWMWPEKVQNLEKLYITGGSLDSLEHKDIQIWKVKYLRLMYLKNLSIDEADLEVLFPECLQLEKIGCGE